ncbi:MAG: hypothetical protein Q9169_005273 [Polycauliona sp. 2 TL-2023]
MARKVHGTIIVTGASGGIGHAIAERFVNHYSKNNTGIFTVRESDSTRAHSLGSVLSKSEGPTSMLPLDLAVLANVRSFAQELNARVSNGSLAPITALILNAGYMSKYKRRFTVDGFETTFQVNYLANFLLVLLLLPSLNRNHARVIYITSVTHNASHAHCRFLPLEKEMWRSLEDLAKSNHLDEMRNPTTAGLRRYAESKLWAVMFMEQLRSQLRSTTALTHVRSLAVDPGCVFSTNIMREQTWFLRKPLRWILRGVTACTVVIAPNGILRTPQKAALDILDACFELDDTAIKHWPEGTYMQGNLLKISSEEARDVNKQLLLWEGSLGLVGLYEGEVTSLCPGKRGMDTAGYITSTA